MSGFQTCKKTKLVWNRGSRWQSSKMWCTPSATSTSKKKQKKKTQTHLHVERFAQNSY